MGNRSPSGPGNTQAISKAIPAQKLACRPIQRTGPSNAVKNLSATDKLELSGVSHLLDTLKSMPIRKELVAEVKALVVSGAYDTDAVLAIVIDRLLDDLEGKDPRQQVGRAFVQGFAQARLARRNQTEPVTHRLEGKVRSVDGGTAYLSLTDESGREAAAACAVDELISFGISVPGDFSCTFIRRDNEVAVRLEPVLRRKLTAEEVRELDEQTERTLGEYDPINDR